MMELSDRPGDRRSPARSAFFRSNPDNRAQSAVNERFDLTSSTETEAILMFVDDQALLNHATTGSGRDMATFLTEPIRARSEWLARNSANIQHAPIAVILYTAAPHVG
jgi:hypothetical protein